jgi:hypothetical protein
MTKILALSQLKAAGACAGALRRFTAAFGKSVQVTPSLAGKYADQFSWDWAADNLLPAPARAAYDRATERAWAEYETAAAPARVKYAAATAAARVKYAAAAAPALALLNSPPSERDGVARAHLWAKYDRDRERALAEYDRDREYARAEYDRAVAPARTKRNKAVARAWATLYTKEGV